MRPSWPVALIALLPLAGGATTDRLPLAPAQPGPGVEGGNFEIRVYVCEQEPTRGLGIAAAVEPEGCRLADGVTVRVEPAEGGEVVSCTTGRFRPGSGSCQVMTPLSQRVRLVPEEDRIRLGPEHFRVVVTQDDTTLPPGYAPLENPIRTAAYSEFAGATFVNLPADHPAVGRHPAVGTWRGDGWHVTFFADGTALATTADGRTLHGAWEPVAGGDEILYKLEAFRPGGAAERRQGTALAPTRFVLQLGSGERLERVFPPTPSDLPAGTPSPGARGG